MKVGPKIVDEGLVFCLDAANPNSYPKSGTTWSDLVGSSSGALTNGPVFDIANGGSIVFDGTNDYINLGKPAYNRGNFSVEVWYQIWAYHTGYRSAIMSCWQTGAGFNNEWSITSGRDISGSSDGGFTVHVDTSGGNVNNRGIYRADGITPELDTWYHQVGTFDGTAAKCYVNGVLIDSVTGFSNNTVITSTENIVINSFYTSSVNYSGKHRVATSRMYNRALSAPEVLQNYEATKKRFL